MVIRSRLLNRLTKGKVEKATGKGGKALHRRRRTLFRAQVAGRAGGSLNICDRGPTAAARPALASANTPTSISSTPREQREGALKDLARDIDPGAKKKAESRGDCKQLRGHRQAVAGRRVPWGQEQRTEGGRPNHQPSCGGGSRSTCSRRWGRCPSWRRRRPDAQGARADREARQAGHCCPRSRGVRPNLSVGDRQRDY